MPRPHREFQKPAPCLAGHLTGGDSHGGVVRMPVGRPRRHQPGVRTGTTTRTGASTRTCGYTYTRARIRTGSYTYTRASTRARTGIRTWAMNISTVAGTRTRTGISTLHKTNSETNLTGQLGHGVCNSAVGQRKLVHTSGRCKPMDGRAHLATPDGGELIRSIRRRIGVRSLPRRGDNHGDRHTMTAGGRDQGACPQCFVVGMGRDHHQPA